MLIRIAMAVTLVLTLSFLVACAEGPAKAKVSKEDVQSTRSTFQSLSLGAPKDEVLASFKHGYELRMSASSVKGVPVEEWKIEAYNDDNWNKSRELFVGFMYFANGKLVETSSSRVDYRSNASIVENWTGGTESPGNGS